jgi:hypothetical protein
MGTTPPIAIIITDSIAPSISPNLVEISKQARSAQNSLQSLRSALAALDNSGVSGLRTVLRDISSSTTLLNTSTSKIGATAQATAVQINRLSASYQSLNFAVQATISTLNQYSASAQTARAASTTFNTAAGTATGGLRSVGSAAHGSVSEIQAASGAIRALEGNFGTSVRAGERFLVNTLRIGPILQAAFPLIGAVAFLGILEIMAEHVEHMVTRLEGLSVAARNASLALLNTAQLVVQGEHGIGDTIFNTFAGRDNAPDITLGDPQKMLAMVNAQLRLRDAISKVNESGKTGLELQQAKVESVREEIKATQDALDKVKALRQLAYQPLTQKIVTQPTPEEIGASQQRGLGIPSATVQVAIPETSKQYKELTGQVNQYDAEIKRLNDDLNILQQAKLPEALKKEPLMEARDGVKAAREQMKQFKEEMAQLKITSAGVVTPEERLHLLVTERSKALKQNIPELDSEIGVVTQEINRQKETLTQLAEKYHDQVEAIGLYSDAQKIQHAQDKIDLQLRKDKLSLTAPEAAAARADAATAIQNAGYERELNRIYTEAVGPLRTYTDGTRAVNKLKADGAISSNQAQIAQNELNLSYRNALNPLNEYTHGLQNQVALLGQYGVNLTVSTEIQKVQEQLRLRGRSLTEGETSQLREFLTQLERQKGIQNDINKLYQDNIGQVEKLTQSVAALQSARAQGIITQEQESVGMAKLKVELADLQIQMGKATGKDILTSVFGSYIKQFEGFTKETTKLYQGMFATIADGAANSLGRAIVYGENLGDALKDVARQALTELISGFIKLGIQWVITAALGEALADAALTAVAIHASLVAEAWAPAAAFASLATLGANAAPADAALASTVIFAQTLGAFTFNKGGVVPGVGSTDSVPAILTPGEGILTQATTRALGGPAAIKALNSGATVSSTSQAGSRVSLNVEVIHDSSTNIQIERLSETQVRVIARQEAQQIVTDQTPGLVAGQISNPNSKVSKSLQQHTTVRPRR